MVKACTCGVKMHVELLYTPRSKSAAIRPTLDPWRANAAEKMGKGGAAIMLFRLSWLRVRCVLVGQKRRVFLKRVLGVLSVQKFDLIPSKETPREALVVRLADIWL